MSSCSEYRTKENVQVILLFSSYLMKYLQINSNASRLSWRMEGGCVAQNLESGTTKDHFSSHFGAEDFTQYVLFRNKYS
jgi:hypothetical protein